MGAIVTWSIIVDLFSNLAVSALVAAIPILFLFIALAVLKMKAHFAAIIATTLSGVIAVYLYDMPPTYACLSILYGAMYGLFPVCWIVIAALFIYNMSVKTGQFEVIKNSLAAISDDRRMQALLIAFAFGAFLEGAAGFGTPVAFTAAMLAGLGVKSVSQAGLNFLPGSIV